LKEVTWLNVQLGPSWKSSFMKKRSRIFILHVAPKMMWSVLSITPAVPKHKIIIDLVLKSHWLLFARLEILLDKTFVLLSRMGFLLEWTKGVGFIDRKGLTKSVTGNKRTTVLLKVTFLVGLR
jgi:hypothetical protein